MKLKALALATLFATSANAAYVQSHDPHIVAPFSLSCKIEIVEPDVSELNINNPNGYYDAAIGKTGEELKASLNTIIAAGHKYLPYTSKSKMDVWKALMLTDEDPNDKNNVILLYTGRSQEKSSKDNGGKDGNLWNREHVYPKSNGGFNKKSAYAYTDIHHLRPADKSINSERGSLEYDWGGDVTLESPWIGNKKTSTTFEPRDEVKGDVARMIFYMAVRYEGYDEGHSFKTPDLELSMTTTNNGTDFGNVCTMLEWNKHDVVDKFESIRNDKIQQIQGNRNPFIDNPKWADELFGDNC